MPVASGQATTPVSSRREKSKVIPIRAFGVQQPHNDDGTTSSSLQSPSPPPSSSLLPPPPEYAMIELNGELMAPVEFPTTETCRTILGTDRDIELGQLQLDSDKTPIMILGSHQLKGKIERIKDPFCLMEKVYGDDDDDTKKKTLVAYQVIGIVKQKYLFNSYPKVIMR